MRKNWLLAAVALAMSVSTSGCAVVLLGNAFPAGSSSPQSRYGFEMSEADRYLADSAEFVRSLDPCGFLTQNDLAALGTVVQLRPDGELSTCSATLNPAGSSATDSISVDLNGYLPSSDDKGTEQITIGGEQVYRENASHGSCRISFPLRDEFDGATAGAMDGYLTESGRSFAAIEVSRSVGDACTTATSVTETALSLLDDPPLRADSKYNLPLAMKDPCAVLEHLPATWTVDRWNPASDPYRCHFTASSATFEDNLAMLDVSLGYVDGDLRSTDREPIQQGGYTVETRGSDSACFADIVLANPVLGMPEEDDTAARYARTVPTLTVLTDHCDSAVALAVATADVLTG
ncbi:MULTISPECIES: hypothetical protein [Rhodococcus]|uniref:DUF3558 domain-containing protein n=1 Tax=Rhodococcus cercidiphylli TaxID=489916 RepID=A0ABU4B1N0_9NOCA|nr:MULTISPECIES: hypothetical protein [Rhodococcus]KAA0923928.1 hypothetical protein FQ188_16530 [Rhodococcus sp. ANT_H53B]MDV6232392.1 hypothetical protein [Rhodococcus cercidiphylli]MDV8058261.1 hypothetical protein [Rhodococcus sp. IEGM 1343]MDV8079428.1 hypothetical protein [Rhodococcus sp. IEGM 1370]